MKKSKFSKPIQNIFDASNHLLWTDELCIFLKGRKLWCFIIGEATKFVKKEDEKNDEFFDQFEDWDCKIIKL